MVSATRSACANATRSGIAVIATLVSSGSRAVPALPGATKTFATRGDCATFHASACSRPPPPMMSTFICSALANTASEPSAQSIAIRPEDVEDAAVVDSAVQRRNVGREHGESVVAERHQRQDGGKGDAAPDVLPRNEHQRITQARLQRVARAPPGRPGVAEIVFRLVMRIAEHEEVHRIGVAVFAIGAACPTAAPGELVFFGSPLRRPRPGRVPRVSRHEDFVLSVLVGVDESPAAGVEPLPQIRAFRRRTDGCREDRGERRNQANYSPSLHFPELPVQ